MKAKHFYDYRIAAGIICVIVFGVAGIVSIALPLELYINPNSSNLTNIERIIYCSLCVFSFICAFILVEICSGAMVGWLTVKGNKIIWRCPLHITRTLRADECEYVGIDDFAGSNRGMPVIRGDEISYIYLSQEPLPEKYHHNISDARCKKGFIKFAYSDKLCQELIRVLPAEKTGYLIAFYNRMQASDRAIERDKQRKKRKRKNKNK